MAKASSQWRKSRAKASVILFEEFTDLESPSRAEGVGRLVAHVVASDDESVERFRDPVNGCLELLRAESHAVAEEASLGVVSGFDETERLPGWKHMAPSFVESS